MTILSPKLASELASFAYSIRDNNRRVKPTPYTQKYFKRPC